MLEIVLPCPTCQSHLLVDEGNAGRDVLCPGCQTKLTLPADLSGRTPVTVAGIPASDAATAAAEDGKRNYPLERTGHLIPVEADESAGAAHRSTHLPTRGRRDLDEPEEMRRLASMAAVPATYDLHNVDTKGRIAFPCPGCQRPVWMTPPDAGQFLDCPGCSQTIIAPDPVHQQPARLAEESADAPRQRTVLPARRQVENLPLGEQAAAGRPKRSGSQMPPERAGTVRGPVPAAERARTPAPGQEPIPARGDVEMSATVHRGPAAPRRVTTATPAATPAAVQAAAASEFEANTPPPQEPASGRTFNKTPPGRIPNFTPRHEVDLSAEQTGQWGSEGKPENTAGFRRTLTTAIIVLLAAGIGVAAYFLRASFAPPSPGVDKEQSENPVAGVLGAKQAISGFFAAATPAEMAKYVRRPEQALPRLERYYSTPARMRERASFTPDWFSDDWREVDNYLDSGVNFIATSLRAGGDNLQPMMLEIPRDGSAPRIDWEHFVAWSETGWDDFLRVTSERAAEFRVTLRTIDYYNFAYTDRNRWLAFRLADAKNSAHCYAYCQAGTPLANAVLDTLREARRNGLIDAATGEEYARVIVRLKYQPEGKPHNQAVIDALVWNDWLQP